MNLRTHQFSLTTLLSDKQLSLERILADVSKLDAASLPHFFVDVAFVVTGMKFVQESHWLESKENSTLNFTSFVKKILKVELVPLLFLHQTLENSSIEEIEQFRKNALIILRVTLNFTKNLPFPENKNFATVTMKLMSELFDFEHQLLLSKDGKSHLGYSLDRTFDVMDEFFNLDFNTDDQDTSLSGTNERIFARSGKGAQSSYITALIALRYLKIPTGSTFVDLGSGYGRVGLCVGLLRPDIHFLGYEIVDNRVRTASAACKKLGIENQVRFFAQDLSANDFKIPDAETYYMYDPFNEETYKHVLAQINEIASRKKINIITSGQARNVLQESAQRGHWSHPQYFQSGNFCLFRSR